MSKIFVIAKHVFMEAARDRILYGIVAFGGIFILVDLFIARLALGDLVMIKSFGLSAIYVFGLIITIFLGASIIHKEIERRTLYFVLSKSVSRAQVIWGKFLGLVLGVAMTIFLMAIIYFIVLVFEGGGWDWAGLLAILGQVLESVLLVALLVFFSSLVRPLTATICATLLVFVGHLLPVFVQNAKEIGGLTYQAALFFYYLMPNLAKFDWRDLAVHGQTVSALIFLSSLVYAVFYSVVLILLAIEFFKRKEI